jgi:hypothetical protein
MVFDKILEIFGVFFIVGSNLAFQFFIFLVCRILSIVFIFLNIEFYEELDFSILHYLSTHFALQF